MIEVFRLYLIVGGMPAAVMAYKANNNISFRIMRIKLSDHFGYRKLAKFTLPTVAMMVFVSVYGVVDGYFVSNFAGKTQFMAN